MGKIVIVCGGQFGSEGKGAITGFLVRELALEHPHFPPFCVRIGGPNAGHTIYDDAGVAWPLRTIPVGVVTPGVKLGIAAGSEIDEHVLYDEIDNLTAHKHDVRSRLFIDNSATVMDSSHKEVEAAQLLQERIGSTAKGIGGARAGRIMRSAKTWNHGEFGCDLTTVLIEHLKNGGDVVIETSQGFGLGLHAGFYPYCTSADCRPIDALAAVGLSPWAPYIDEVEPWLVFRTYPIRVAGNSGPLFKELTWDELAQRSYGHIKPEQTTVTKKTRRVGEWDARLAQRAVEAAGSPYRIRTALTFFDYLSPDLYEQTKREYFVEHHQNILLPIENSISQDIYFDLIGTGPRTVIDMRYSK